MEAPDSAARRAQGAPAAHARRPSLAGPSLAEYAPRFVLVVAAYYAAARLGLVLAFGHSNVTPVWPPSGIAVAALVLFGIRLWPAAALGALLANITTGLSPAVSAGLTVGNTAEYVLAALLIRRFEFHPTIERLRDVAVLAVVAFASPLVAASLGTASLWAGGIVSSSDAATVWTTYWVGDGMGILVFAPVILVLRNLRPSSLPFGASLPEAVGLGVAVLVTTTAVFLGGLPYPYLIFPVVFWAALRFGQVGATGVSVVSSAIAIWATVHQLGPFSSHSQHQNLIDLQLFLAALVVTSMVLAATLLTRRDAERRLEARTTELEISNKDLEDFSYTVSHDLRAPLRAIDGFSRVMIDDYSSEFSPEVNRHLSTISRSARQMGELIDALLNFSRLGRQPMRHRMADPKAIARDAWDGLKDTFAEREIEITFADLPACRCDPALLKQVYVNLIENAAKFTRDRRPARIEVGFQGEPGVPPRTVYFVRDNGIGFDQTYALKIFGVFQRLAPSDFPGTGAGLAVAQKIIQRHDGRIWAAAARGTGATFYFTIGDRRRGD